MKYLLLINSTKISIKTWEGSLYLYIIYLNANGLKNFPIISQIYHFNFFNVVTLNIILLACVSLFWFCLELVVGVLEQFRTCDKISEKPLVYKINTMWDSKIISFSHTIDSLGSIFLFCFIVGHMFIF